MRIIGSLISLMLAFVFFIALCIPQISCSKTITEHDTAYINKYDTTISVIHDTTIIIDTVCMQGLVAYYNFNNGNLNDSSGQNNNIAFNNAVTTTDRLGRANNAYRFTGGTYMRVPNSGSLNPTQITLMAIVKFDKFYTGVGYHNQIFMKGPQDAADGVYGLRAHPLSYDGIPADTLSEMFIGIYGDGSNAFIVDSTTIIQHEVWYNVVYTYDGLQTRIYVNGVLDKSSTAPFMFTSNTNDLYIGKTENTTYPYYLEGSIDEIRIYNRAISASEVTQLNAMTK